MVASTNIFPIYDMGSTLWSDIILRKKDDAYNSKKNLIILLDTFVWYSPCINALHIVSVVCVNTESNTTWALLPHMDLLVLTIQLQTDNNKQQ